jgi:hypothetical protein
VAQRPPLPPFTEGTARQKVQGRNVRQGGSTSAGTETERGTVMITCGGSERTFPSGTAAMATNCGSSTTTGTCGGVEKDRALQIRGELAVRSAQWEALSLLSPRASAEDPPLGLIDGHVVDAGLQAVIETAAQRHSRSKTWPTDRLIRPYQSLTLILSLCLGPRRQRHLLASAEASWPR